ncbi:MAG: tRNA (adenosine(37)-N6)-threonylcarbamoyltransferase complex dimerization subunit type 1 TsaB [Anaerolineales bacterium]|jgi:tRNA threonylcarbamoyladenosine biosynthesis protein TsaB
MMLLAIDTSTQMLGVALYDGVQILSEMSWISRGHHTRELAPAIVETLTRCHVDVSMLGALGVAIGPGSFTGLRIGLAVAKGLAYSHHLSLIGIPTLDILAAAQPLRVDLTLATVLRAGRKRLAVGWYKASDDAWESAGDVENMTLEALANRIKEPTLVCGELTKPIRRRLKRKYRNVILVSAAQSVRRPAVLAELAWKRWQAGDFDNSATLSPIYLHHGEAIPE